MMNHAVRKNQTPDHISVVEPGKCWHCEKPTRYVEVNFETYLCPGECTNSKLVEYIRDSARGSGE